MLNGLSLVSIVEDDFSVRRALHRLVEAAGYPVETFASAREFLDSSPQGRTACLVLDIHLDGLSGFDLQERLATDRPPRIPIIFITAHDDTATRERVGRSGAVAYLPKPCDEKDLLDAIQKAVGVNHGPPGGSPAA